MADVALRDVDREALKKTLKRTSKPKKRNRSRTESIVRQIDKRASKMIQEKTHRRAPQFDSNVYTLCYFSGLPVPIENCFRIPMKNVSNISSSMTPEAYRETIKFAGNFISPVAILLFLNNNPQIETSRELAKNVINFYDLDEKFENARMSELDAIALQPDTPERNALYQKRIQPTEQNNFHLQRGGNITFKGIRKPTPSRSSRKRTREENDFSPPHIKDTNTNVELQTPPTSSDPPSLPVIVITKQPTTTTTTTTTKKKRDSSSTKHRSKRQKTSSSKDSSKNTSEWDNTLAATIEQALISASDWCSFPETPSESESD